MALESVHSQVRKSEQVYLRGSVILGKYLTWSMHDTIETIFAYLNSRHITGPTDALGREKPFFNIVTAAKNIWYRATEIERKNIKFVPQTSSSVVLAFIANVILQKWMDDNNFGAWLQRWGDTLAGYGSSVVKFVERDGKLIPSVTPWQHLIPDAIDFRSIPVIEKFYKTPAQLKAMATPGHPDYAHYSMDTVEKLLDTMQPRRTLDYQQQDNQTDFVELYEVHGLMDTRLLEDDPDYGLPDDQIKYCQQMHVISFIHAEDEEDYIDFTLFKGKERVNPYEITHLIEEDGRTLAIGAVEYLFDAQWMTNHSVKSMKDTLDLASRVIFQTADDKFVSRNVLQSIETGDILIHQVNMPLERVSNDKPDVMAFSEFSEMWQDMGKELTSTPDAMRGTNDKGKVPYALESLLTQQANSLFEVMTVNKGIALENILRKYVIPYIKKQLKNKDEIVAVLDDAGIKEIDAQFIPREAIKRFNDRTTEQMFKNASKLANDIIQNGSKAHTVGPLPQFNPQQEQQQLQTQMQSLGNKRFLVPDKIGKKTWADLLSDFEWDNIKVEITNENVDKQHVLSTLSMVLQTIASNPNILQDPNAKMLFNKILMETSVISPMEIMATPAPPQAAPAPVSIPQTAAAPVSKPVVSTAAPLIGGQ